MYSNFMKTKFWHLNVFFLLLLLNFSSYAALTIVDMGAESGLNRFGRYSQTIVDSMGYPIVVFADDPDFIYIIHCNDVDCSGGDDLAQRLIGVNGNFIPNFLALDAAGFPIISVFNSTNLILIRCNDSNCESPPIVTTLLNKNGSMTLDASGNPIIAYSDSNIDGTGLFLIHCDDIICAGGNDMPIVVDNLGAETNSINVVVDVLGNPVISYQGIGIMRLTHCLDSMCNTQSKQLIESVALTPTSSLLLDSQGYPVIASNFNGTSFHLIHCNDINCDPTVNGAESNQTVPIDSAFFDFTLTSLDLPVIAFTQSSQIKVLTCTNINCTTGSTFISSIAGSVVFEVSIVLDSNEFPIVASFTSGSMLAGVRMHHCNDTLCLGANETNIILNKFKINVGQYGDMLKVGNEFLFSYYDSSNKSIRFRRCEDSSCTGLLSPIQVLEDSPTEDIGRFSQVALPANNIPLVVYYNTGGALRIASCANTDCSGTPVLFPIDANQDVGQFNSMQLDNSDLPIISYYDATNGDLKIAHCAANSCISASNSILTVDTGGSDDVGQYTSLITDINGFPVVSYFDVTNGALKLLHCNDVNCDSSINGVESIAIVDSGMGSVVGLYTSLQLDATGFPVISYYDSSNGSLKLAHCGDENCILDNSITTIDSGASHDVGQYSLLKLDTNGFPVIAYYDATSKDLWLTHCDDQNCIGSNEPKILAYSNGEVGTFLAMNINGNTAYISFYNATTDERQMIDVVLPMPLPPLIFANGFE